MCIYTVSLQHTYIIRMMAWSLGHLAILKLLLAHLLHIVKTVVGVGVVKFYGFACRGQFLSSYL